MSQFPEDKGKQLAGVDDDAGFFDTFNVSSIGDVFRDAIKGTGAAVSKLSDGSASLVSKDPHKRGLMQAGLTMLGHGLGSNVRDRTNPFIEGANAYFGHIDEQARISKEDEIRNAALAKEQEALQYGRGRDALQDQRYTSEQELAAERYTSERGLAAEQYKDTLAHQEYLRKTARIEALGKNASAAGKAPDAVVSEAMKDNLASHLADLNRHLEDIHMTNADGKESSLYSADEQKRYGEAIKHHIRNIKMLQRALANYKDGDVLSKTDAAALKNAFTTIPGNPQTVASQ